MKTLVDLVEQRAEEFGDKQLFTFLVDGDRVEQHMSYAALRTQARTIAAELQRLGAAGERALLLYPPGLDYVAAFFGCLHADVIAVPAYPPNPAALDRTLPRLLAIAADARASIIMTTGPLRALAAGVLGAEHQFRWVATDTLDPALAGAWRHPAPNPTGLAFLQYTSGSTDTPKGVMVSHANLLANSGTIRDSFKHTAESRGVIWLPPYHDMGLIGGIIQPLFMGASSVLMSPLHFLQRPLRWLTAISRYRATTSGGPNFAYELCIRKTTPEQRAALDLSSWQCAFNGAEPIRSETLARFADVFAPAGFRPTAMYPCYGLAEATLIATGGDLGSGPTVRRFDTRALGRRRVVPVETGGTALVGNGPAVTGTVAIVDPETTRACAPGDIGEIWLASPSVAGGYYRREDDTVRAFRATRADTGEGPYLRTGDLGFVHDGELFVAGRSKDVVIIRGHNHYAQDLEHAAESSHPALRPGCGAAFGIDEGGEERLVLTYEIEKAHAEATDAIIEAVRRAIAETSDVSVHAVVLVEQRSIPKTSSGKIQRYACRAAYLAGELSAISTWRAPAAPPAVEAAPVLAVDEAALVRWLVERVHEMTGLPSDRIDTRSAFAQFGMSSLQMVELTGLLETHLSRRLAPTLTYSHPTIARLARHLSDRAPASAAFEQSGTAEPIAIVGIGCRFPQADGPDAFWKLLLGGGDAIRELPEARRRLVPGAQPRLGGYLDDIEQFDPELFRLSQREADAMDPQQRLLLEVTWRALEDAGQPIASLAGTPTGVFVGISASDYGRRTGAGDIYSITGNALSIAANRVSYALDLGGPSVAIDTACSSSLVAVHLACQSLRTGESTLALAGGVNLVLSDQITEALDAAGFLAPDGRCKAFDASADGYVRGEGAGVVVLKSLSRARADGDRIYAVIRGSAVNSDGHSNGLTAPSLHAQETVLRRAYAVAQVDPRDVEYVEAHGTGTALGDPIEAAAISMALGHDAPRRLGSVKTNIGHLESAAGIAGLIKTALALHHRELPGSLHQTKPNTAIRFADWNLSVPAAPTRWRSESAIAGCSSFGFGGTNAHVVLAMEPRTEHRELGGANPQVVLAMEPPASTAAYILPVSAHDADAARVLAVAYADAITEPVFADTCHAAQARRDHHEHRLAIVAGSAAEAAERLRTATPGRRRAGQSPALVMVFSGQGSQWPRIGHELLAEPAFKTALEACDRSLRAHAGWSLVEALADESASRLTATDVAQPVLVGVQIALAALLRDWGLAPTAVVGHSLGEIAAAHVAGAITVDDAMRIAWHRGRLLARAGGGMALVERSHDEVAALLGGLDRVNIAAINAPTETVVSGDPDQLAELARRVPCRELPSRYAFHSAVMAPYQQPLADALAGLVSRATSVPMISTVTGDVIAGDSLGPAYWARQIREPVQFAAAIEHVAASHFIELGVPVLGSSLQQIVGERGLVVSALRRKVSDRTAIAEAVAQLYTHGQDLAWERMHAATSPVVALPPMPWIKRRCWLEPKNETTASDGHPLLGRRVPLAVGHAWAGAIDARRLPYLTEHRFEDAAIVPATAWLEMAMAAVIESGRPGCLEDIELRRPLIVDGNARSTQVSITTDAGRDRIRLFTRDDADAWRLHATSTIGTVTAAARVEIDAVRTRCTETVSVTGFHDELGRRGLQYGASFRGIAELHRGRDEALAKVELPAALAREAARYELHPALLDACAQIIAALDPSGRPFVPTGARSARWLARPGRTVWSWARATDASRTLFDLVIADETGAPIAEILGLKIRHLDEATRGTSDLYEPRWDKKPLRTLPAAREPGTWLVLADAGGVATALAERLAAGGDRCILVRTRDELDRVRDDVRGVLHLWSLDTAALATASALEAEHARIVESAIAVVQRAKAPLWIVTRGTQPVGDTPIATVPSVLWGFGRTVAQEHPELLGGLVDLAPGATPAQDVAALHRELTASDGETQVAHREARHVARLVRTSVPASELACKADGTYLVTGGLGGIGLVAARALAARGARRIILMARTALPPRSEWSGTLPPRVAVQIAAIRELEARGVAIHLAAVDVGDETQLTAFLDGFRREAWPPIRGVVHLAGILHDATLARLQPSLVAEVFRAKVSGAWLLDRLITEPLDFFVMFSSTAALLGSAGQASYAAANAFLDALAHDRRRRGLPALAIDWGPWAEVGLAAAAGRGDRLSRSGVASIAPDEGAAMFGQLAASTATQIAVTSIDWAQLARNFPSIAAAPFLREVVVATETRARQRVQLDAAALTDLLTKEIGRAAGSAVPIKPDVPLDRLGIDSLMGIELRVRLENELGIAIPIGLLLAGPTIAELATTLAARLAAPVAPTSAPSARSTITAIQPLGTLPAFTCIHPGALDSAAYEALASRLGTERPFRCLRLAELESSYALDGEVSPSTIEELAAHCVDALVAVQPAGPYLLGGWSLGGVLAFEAARQLEARGARVELVALFDSPTARPLDVPEPALVRAFASYLGARAGLVFPRPDAGFHDLDGDAQLAHVLSWARTAQLLPAAASLAQIKSLLSAYTRGLRWGTDHLTGYAPAPCAAPIAYFRAGEALAAYDRAFPDATAWWARQSPRVKLVDVPGDHYTMFLPPNVDVLASQLREVLAW